jgi:hypothetical protein
MDGRPRAMHSAMSRWSNDTRVSCPEISQSLAAAAAFLFSRAGLGRRRPNAGRIAELLGKERFHARGDRQFDGCACVVVEVDSPHGQNTNSVGASRRPL